MRGKIHYYYQIHTFETMPEICGDIILEIIFMILIGIIMELTGTDYDTSMGILYLIEGICMILGWKNVTKLGKGAYLDKDGDER